MYLTLFLSFLQVGLLSIGGGYAAIPLIQNQVVHQHAWMTMDEFTNLVTIAEMTPGPIAINSATFVGMRIGGLPGAVCATLGCIAPSLLIVSLLYALYVRYRRLPMLSSILRCLRPAVVALIAAAALSILSQVLFGGGVDISAFRPLGAMLFGAALVLLLRFHLSPILVMVLCGAASLLIRLPSI